MAAGCWEAGPSGTLGKMQNVASLPMTVANDADKLAGSKFSHMGRFPQDGERSKMWHLFEKN